MKERLRDLSMHSDGVLAVGIIGLVLLLIIPLPPLILDALLCLSLVFSVMVLLLTLYIENSLEFSAFPSLLLVLTLFRLGLNIASTRMILSDGYAGDIIQTFGDFVIQDAVLTGLIIFLLLTIINFIVVTKGAARIAEVAARFTLEAMPGKQMSTDSELASGLISHAEAQAQRKKIAAEADFFGAMDGASKFVKGDAIAGVLITAVNIVGGFIVGVLVKGLGVQECWSVMMRLTIGDGLVSQIPALLISIGAAMMVTRASSGSLGKAVPKQIFHQPKVLMMAALTLLIISLMPGMPFWLMLPLSGTLFAIGFYKLKSKPFSKAEKISPSFLAVPLEIQLGFEAVILSEPLQDQLKDIREELLLSLGLRVPALHISSKSDMDPTGWAILIKGVQVAQGREAELIQLKGELQKAIVSHAHELINRQDVAQMILEAKNYDSALVEELYPTKLNLGQILRVVQNLLKEAVPIRDFVTILETLADVAGEKNDLDQLTESVRQALSPKISQVFFGKTRMAHIITLDPKLEQLIATAKANLRPKTQELLTQKISEIHQKTLTRGIRAILITSAASRMHLKKIIEQHLPELPVLTYKEITKEIEVVSLGEIPNEVML